MFDNFLLYLKWDECCLNKFINASRQIVLQVTNRYGIIQLFRFRLVIQDRYQRGYYSG